MINRISEIPFWGPEEQIRKFINQHDDPMFVFENATDEVLDNALSELGYDGEPLDSKDGKRDKIHSLIKDLAPDTFTDEQKEQWFKDNLTNWLHYQQTLTQARIENIDEIFQKQILWSYGRTGNAANDAYFYWDWCPMGSGTEEDPKWQICIPLDSRENLQRDIDRTFNWRDFQGYTNTRDADEMPINYDASSDEHALVQKDDDDITDLDKDTLRHNVMKSYVEVSEYLGEKAMEYGSHNGYVSRKMSLAWLFNAIRALINWKMDSQDKWAEVDIYPLVADGKDSENKDIRERFLSQGEESTQGIQYSDETDLSQVDGICEQQSKVRAKKPDVNGVLKVRGNEWHYGERAYFYTHNSFIGECRFFHNARFLGQTTFDKEINGTALRSRWADLAEYREADFEYEPGTLVMFGGEKEITLSRGGVANAVVTTKPGLILNGDEPSKDCIMVGIALIGTVPVKTVGGVKKFDRLVADKKYPGMARARKWWEFWKKPIAIALESFPAGGTINCMTKMEF